MVFHLCDSTAAKTTSPSLRIIVDSSYLYEKPEQFPAPANRTPPSVHAAP